MASSSSFPQAGQVVAQFLEAVVHSVLYHRNVYPQTSFETTQLYGMAVHYNRHPEVSDYIRDVATKATSGGHILGEVRVLISRETGGLSEDEDHDAGDVVDDSQPCESSCEEETYRLLFSPAAFSYDDLEQNEATKNERSAEKLKWYRMHDDFRATLLRLEVVCRSRTVPTDPDALARRTFRVQLLTIGGNRSRTSGNDQDDNSWMVVERPAARPGPRRATPIHTVRLVDGFDVSIRME